MAFLTGSERTNEAGEGAWHLGATHVSYNAVAPNIAPGCQ